MRPLLLLLLVVPLSGCALLQQVVQPPEVRFDKARFRAADFEQLGVDLDFRVTNPNPLGARLDGYSIKLVVDGLTLLDGDVDQALDLGAGASTTLTLPATVKWAEIASKIGDVASGEPLPDDVPWSAAGSFAVDTAVGRLNIPFNVGGKLPVLAPPLVVPAAVEVTSATPLGVQLAIGVDVTNPTGRSMHVQQMEHALALNGRAIAAGGVLADGPVAARKTERRTLTVSLSTIEAGVALISALTGGGQVQVGYAGRLNIDTGFGVVPLRFDVADGLRVGN
jgi:LEA14-like dessication related protein